jgi:ubiquinone/menaquinone biosynthesis C-methylase UbiE
LKLGRIEKWFMKRSGHIERTINRADKLLGFIEISPDQSMLEVGCGSGGVSRYIAGKYLLNVTGTDLDPDLVQLARESIDDTSDIQFLKADATNLPFEDNHFDIVLSFGVMHHISNWLDALNEIKRVLKPEGYFIYFDIVYPEFTAWVGRLFKHKYGITTLQDLNSFIEKNNFSVIHSSVSKSLFLHHYEAVYRKD